MANTEDTVCGMEIDPDTAAGKSEYKGQAYYFCAQAEREALIRKDPEKYVNAARKKHEHYL